ncbi:type I polyketide synthase [Sorangium sp. So ce321]|uniref:type I polyketide synthase n=1 Tax=Sorangium sp. So ce321 TaxID=3133300 RepID=UPI003F611856
MQAVSELVAELSPDERAVLSSLLAPRPEPIAIVGIGCRLPGGAGDPASFWRLLAERGDAVREIPADRWDVDAFYDPDPDAPGKMYTRYGAFLDRVDGFDPHFFEITPREAARMDPQQRLLLEVVWEALEDAGQPPDGMRRSRTGVFVGGSWRDYELLHTRGGGLAQVDPHTLTGDLASVLAGRVSYTLGLEGPSMMVDTACSSSLVAIHLACESLRSDRCNLALAGGASLILAPDGFVKLSKMRALSPDGRCRTFDVRASGFARGEGVGVLVLKRLSDARRAGDRIWAVIRGSAVNHDGRSAGLSAPSSLAQRGVIRAALEAAGVSPSEVGYIEAHGTGTPLGDPIEMEVLKDIFGDPRPDGSVCAVGSVKTNIGHIEAAAGVAGVIKAVLALRHGVIPAHLHWTQLNPRISLEGTPLVIPVEARSWPRGGAERIAGVSSFGISGTNAHVVLAEAPEPERRPEGQRHGHHVITLSAKTETALGELAVRYAAALSADASIELPDVAFTANLGRARHAFRAALVAGSTAEAAPLLAAFSRGDRPTGVLSGEATARPKVAFVLSGRAGDRAGFGRHLYETEPAFREALDRCDQLFRPLLDGSVLRALLPPAGAPSAFPAGRYERPAVFALEVALCALWRAFGVEPDLVMGCGVGEVTAAYVAGALSLEQAAALAAGREPPIDARPPARIGIVSCSIGRLMRPDEVPDRATWARTTELEVGVQALHAEGCGIFVALGPASGLPPAAPAVWIPSIAAPGDEVVPLLHGLAALSVRGVQVDWAKLHERRPGRRISLPTYPFQRESLWLPVRRPSGGDARRLLPRAAAEAGDPLLGGRVASPMSALQFEARVAASSMPLLRMESRSGLKEPTESRPTSMHPLPEEPMLVPVAIHLGRLLAASTQALGCEEALLEDLAFPEPMLLRRRDDERISHLTLVPEPTGALFSVSIASIPADSPPDRARWTTHATGKLRDVEAGPAPAAVRPEAIGGGATAVVDRDGFYARLEASGHRPLGAARWVERAALGPDGVSAEIAIPDGKDGKEGVAVPLSVALLHAALEVVLAAALAHPAPEGALPVPLSLSRLRYAGARRGEGPWTCDARAVPGAPGDPFTVAWTLRDSAGRAVVDAVGLAIGWRSRSDLLGKLAARQAELLYELSWRPKPQAPDRSARAPARWILLAGGSELGQGLAARLEQQGGAPILVRAEAGGDRDAPLAEVLRLLEGDGGPSGVPVAGIVDLRAADEAPRGVQRASGDHADLRLCDSVLRLARALADRKGRAGMGAPPRLWLATRGAQAVQVHEGDGGRRSPTHVEGDGGRRSPTQVEGDGERRSPTQVDDARGFAGAPLWGLGRVLAAEHPDLSGGLIDLDPARPPAEESMLAEHLLGADVEPEIAFRGGARYLPRVGRCPGLAGAGEPTALRTGATYLITGGLGALGLGWARWMVGRGARHVVLVGRRSPGLEAQAALSGLRAKGARVHVVQADVAQRDDVAALFRRIDAMPPLAGIVHAAGVTEDAVLTNTDAASFDRVLAPKVRGSENLWAEARGRDLDFFVFFSSVSALLGNPGQAAYAAANAFQDAFAAHLRAQGAPALSIAWGPFAGAGMAHDVLDALGRRWGLSGLAPDEALTLFEHMLRWNRAHIIAMDLDPVRLSKRAAGAALPVLFAGIAAPAELSEAESPHGENDLARRILRSSPDKRMGMLIHEVTAVVQSIMGLDQSLSLNPDQRLDELGMDSMLAIEVVQGLSQAFGMTLPVTMAMDHPTVSAMASYLERELGVLP